MLEVYLEISAKRTFAVALEWPGLCRSGRDEAAALQSLVASGGRYRAVAAAAGIDFVPPVGTDDLIVTERLAGDGTTDFGAPGRVPAEDTRPVDTVELHRLVGLIRACWEAYDRAVEAAAGKELRKGPRGGGRDLEQIMLHVAEVEAAYVRQAGWRSGTPAVHRGDEASIREATVEALGAGSRGELPARGPRGGRYWTTRYLARRAAWHLLDHAWEIEDRAGEPPPAPDSGATLPSHTRDDRVELKVLDAEGR